MHLLNFTLNEAQRCTVKASLDKLEGAHRTRVAWVDDYLLNGQELTIHARDLLSVLSYSQRNSDNEMDLFRLRKAAMDQLADLKTSARNEIKKQNYEMWLESYKKLWPGSEGDVDIRSTSPQPDHIELVP
ncbi:MAG: hypothetical protein IPL83_02535 [Bdellovibrionales bacterium]|nr:hypothetical protein [Bdellovibrionales bacterium]